MGSMMNPEPMKRLGPVLKKQRVLIVVHNNPDPDAIAAAWAFRFLLKKKFKVDSVIAYGGLITRPENRSMVERLRIDLKPIEGVDLRRFTVAALIDTQPRFRNHSLPPSLKPAIVIDHHGKSPDSRSVELSDIRPHYGSTSTIVGEYLIQTGLPLHGPIATALYYGIRSDTLDLGREAGEADFRVAAALYPKVQHKTVAMIAHPEFSREYVLDYDRALHEAQIYGDVILADLGYLRNTDMVAMMADFFLQIAGMRLSLVLARDGRNLFFSLRTKRLKQNAGRMAQRLVKGWGAAGGHGQVAGGQIPLQGRPAGKDEEMAEALIRRLLKMVARDKSPKEKLLPPL